MTTTNLSETMVNSSYTVQQNTHESVQLVLSETSSGTPSIAGEYILERDSSLDIVIVVLPGASVQLPLRIILKGEGANVNVSGIYLCPGSEKVKLSLDVVHQVPHCSSSQLFKGIVSAESTVDFYGKIVVEQDAQKTEAYQENHNLLLSDQAKVNTKPQLEIYADDVKCSHGATVGRLDEDAQFYMRSRGITLQQAKALQMLSFVSPVLSRLVKDKESIVLSVEKAIQTISSSLQ